MFINAPDPPMTLAAEEQARLLEVVARQGCRRDLALLTLALSTGLRLSELVGLNVGDVGTKSGEVAWKVHLEKGITKGRRGGVAFLPEKVRSVLADHLASKKVIGFSIAQKTRLFSSRVKAAGSRRGGSRRSSSTGNGSRGSNAPTTSMPCVTPRSRTSTEPRRISS